MLGLLDVHWSLKFCKTYSWISTYNQISLCCFKAFHRDAMLGQMYYKCQGNQRGNLWEEVYVSQLDGFVDTDNPNHMVQAEESSLLVETSSTRVITPIIWYKLKKALYWLKQAPHAWYDKLSSFLISQDFSKGLVDPTLFIRRESKELLLGQIYARPTEKHIHAVKRIFWYLRGTVNQGLWYPKDSSIALIAFADADHAGCQDTRRSSSGSMQLLGDRLVSWSSKRQKSAAISSTKAEYITLSGCCA
nr:uncharacterized mitochondrial protein AtMg00810-like [Tanacetum cinerariifolium]